MRRDFAHRKRSAESQERGKAAAARRPEPGYLTGTATKLLQRADIRTPSPSSSPSTSI